MSVEPVTINETKAHARIDLGDDDALIDSYIEMARARIEDSTGRILKRRTLSVRLEYRGGFWETFQLHRAPVNALLSMYGYDSSGIQTNIDVNSFTLIEGANAPKLIYKGTARLNLIDDNIYASLDCGYDKRESIPAALRAATLMLVAHMYEHRGDSTVSLPDPVANLIAPHRLWRFN